MFPHWSQRIHDNVSITFTTYYDALKVIRSVSKIREMENWLNVRDENSSDTDPHATDTE